MTTSGTRSMLVYGATGKAGRLVVERARVVGSPEYMAKHGTPRKPEDLLQYDCIAFRWSTGDSLYAWEFERGRRTWRIPVRGGIVTLFADGGPQGRVIGGIRNLTRPLVGAAKVAPFVATASRAAQASVEQSQLNGQAALVFTRQGETFAALLLGVADGKIQYLFFQADPARLRFVSPAALPGGNR